VEVARYHGPTLGSMDEPRNRRAHGHHSPVAPWLDGEAACSTQDQWADFRSSRWLTVNNNKETWLHPVIILLIISLGDDKEESNC
jgi:hypothetical protein